MTIITANRVETIADELLDALRGRYAIPPLTDRYPDMTIDEAYRISLHALRSREADGERLIGKKIGVTSRAVQEMLDVHQPDFGFLTDRMLYADGAKVSLAQAGLVQPRAEGEIAFMLSDDLPASGVTREDVLDATEWVAPCFEIVDSRIEEWKIRIQDTVADNASCGIFAIGESRISPRELDLASVHMTIHKNDELAAEGSGAAVQGHPGEAVAWLANTLGAYGLPLRHGDLILSGALAPLLPVTAGDRFELTIEGLGSSHIAFC